MHEQEIVRHQQAAEASTSIARARFEAKVTKEMTPFLQGNHITPIQGRQYLTVAGATALASACGYAVREVGVVRVDIGGTGAWEATCEIVERETGLVIGRGSGLVMDDERPWSSRPRFAQRAMASTRAAGRALRLSLGHLFALVGAQTCTAEEMPDDR